MVVGGSAWGPPRVSVVAALLTALLTAACGGNEYAPPPPPTVTVAQPQVRDVTEYAEYTGSMRAVESVEVRARVKGFLLEMYFEPGDLVEKDAPLFLIDPEPFEVALESAEADLASAKAEHALAQTEFERTQQMYDQSATSELVLFRKRAERDKSSATVAAAAAAVHSAKLDLEYAHVKAPITGRVGRELIDMGNLVGAGEATLLTEMVRYAPIYVYFHISERDLLELQSDSRRRRKASGQSFAERPPTRVEVARSDEVGFPHIGEIDFTALEVDPDTGTFEVRGILPNEGATDEIIFPGSFVRVRFPIGNRTDAIIVPESALGADQSGRYALVVNSDDVVEQRRVVPGTKLGDERVILEGLRADDRVVINGLQRARPGAKVQPQQAGTAAPQQPTG